MNNPFESFLTYLFKERNYSEHTLGAYRRDLMQFNLFLKDNFEIGVVEVEKKQIRHWLIHLYEKGFVEVTINRKLATLKSYYNFLVIIEERSSNPARLVKSLKTPSRLPINYNQKEMDRVLAPSLFSDDFSGIRDYGVLLLFYTTGLRRAELIGLELKDVDLGRAELKVLGKGMKERVLPMIPEMVQILYKYLSLRKEAFPCSCQSLFLTNKGNKLYPKFVYNLVKHYLSVGVIGKVKSPHKLRHSFATHLLDSGAEINSIKTMLGHSSLSATQIYTNHSAEKLKRIYKSYHPRGEK